MTLSATLDAIGANLGMQIEIVITVVVCMGLLVFYAKDFKLGIVITFLITALLTMLFWSQNMNYIPALSVMMISFVVMSLTFYAITKVSAKGGVI